jgi:hypothetical protein
MMAKLQATDSIIFDSWYKLITHLRNQDQPHIILLRTFGDDLPRVIEDIHHHLGTVLFTTMGTFKDGKLYITTPGKEQCLETTQEIYTFIKNNNGHIAIQDDWKRWNMHHERKEYGKMFPIDLADTNATSIFFDDNIIAEQSETNIVAPLDMAGNALDVPVLIARNTMVVVDTIEAILDDNYFIDKVIPKIS